MMSRGSPHPNLARLEEAGRLLREPASGAEIGGFIAAAEGYLGDCITPGLSHAGRFKLAYDAAHTMALAALRAHDYRPRRGEGHRAIVFQVLEHTIGAEKGLWVALSKYHEKRNAADYEGVLDVTAAEADDIAALALRLSEAVKAWLGANRPELLKSGGEPGNGPRKKT